MTLDPRPVPPGLQKFWSSPVSAFATLQPNVIAAKDAERHRIFSLLLMSMLLGKWNGNKDGQGGDYGNWRAKQLMTSPGSSPQVYRGGTYQGHNIAALAVDGEGRIIDFEFNHNAVLDSTVEHAESRLVRRVFALNQVYEPWLALEDDGGTPSARRAERPHQRQRVFATAASDRPAPSRTGRDIGTDAVTPPSPYSTLLKDVTIYTSLESCAQCSGIMCLASVKDIVYLQWDQGQFLVGNMMWQATTAQAMGFIAPRPIRGDEFGFQYFTQLNAAFVQFANAVGPNNPFYTGTDKNGMKFTDTAKAVTSFLCTDAALAIYQQAAADFGKWTLTYPTYQPTPNALTNQEAFTEAKDFLGWVNQLDNRGAPHRV